QGFWTKGRTRGAAPMKKRPFRRGKAAPHITAAKPRLTSRRQSRASHHGGKAAPHITAAKPRLTSRRQSRASHHGGEAAPHITAAKPLRTDSLCKAALKRPVTAEDAEGRRAPQRRQRSQLVPSVQSWGVKSLRLCPRKTTASLRKLSVLYSSNQSNVAEQGK